MLNLACHSPELLLHLAGFGPGLFQNRELNLRFPQLGLSILSSAGASGNFYSAASAQNDQRRVVICIEISGAPGTDDIERPGVAPVVDPAGLDGALCAPAQSVLRHDDRARKFDRRIRLSCDD